ncbi:MAG TPA: DUF11 domain-containing protein, partial [Vicinamibacteria bacterium]|nr:DUF11 domain-containing protein [Vicinamibacteria bacterium]
MASRSQAPRFGSLLAVLGLAGFTSLVAPPAQATIAIGAPVSAGRRCTNVTPGTTNVVTTPALTPAGANRLLVVGVSINRNNSPAAVVGGVTFGGLPLTQLGQATEPTNNDRRVELWYLVNPAAGAFPVITTINGLTATNTGVVVGAISFSEVDTAAPFGAVATATGVNQAGSTLNVASLAGDAVIDTVAVGGNRTVSLPGGSGQTQRWNLNSTNNNSGTDVTGFGSTEPATAAATTMSETFSGNSDWAQIGVAVKPAPADLAITKTDSVDPIAVSQNTTYTITVTNNGPGGATNVAMTDPLPAGMGYVSATPSQGSCSGTSTVTCDLGTIASGGSATVSIVVTGAVTGTHSNTATVAATETDPNSANNSATETTTVTPLTDLAIVKSGPALAYLGDAVSYTLTASNGGPSPAMNVTVTDVLPAGTVFWSAIPSQGSCSGTTTVVCTLGSIASGAGATVTITVQVMVLGVLSNTATVAGSEPDPNLADNSSTLLTTVAQIATADLAISKSGNPASVAIGANVTYTVVVVNNGPDTAPGVTVTDPVPAGMTLVSANSTLGTCSGTLIVTCNLGSMANGAVATITMVATVGSAGTKSNTATVALDTATAYDPNPVNDTATATTAVSGGTAPLCSVPGSIGPGGTLSGVINTYYPGTASVAPGGTSITLGAARGATTPVGIGDLLLVIQMQDAQINSTNTDCYGAGVACQNLINGTGPGAGAIPGTVNAGKYEFVRATNAVPLLGGTLNLQGVGAGNGLVNGYTDTNATAAKGQSRFQVVRGLEFTSATLSSATPVTAAAWTTDASGRGTGGVLALDVAGTLTMGAGLIATVDGLGFRGAAGRQLAGEGGTCSVPAVTPNGQDWRGPTGTGSADPCDTHGGKGEGNAGTPLWVYNPSGVHTCGSGTYPNIVNTNQPNDGYPNGSMARGAPGNAGGGSTDPNPASNDQNSGGGGGSNGGAGGTGGRSWFSNLDRGGRGAAVTPSFSQLVLGGGGGAGTRNNDNCGSNGATAADEGQASSGAAGGGLMLLRAASFAITAGALVTANGADAYDETKNDGGGGGGAGGSVVLTVTSGTMGGLSVQAIGGNGGSAWKTADGTTNPG